MLETGVQGADFEWVEAVEGFVVIFDVDVQWDELTMAPWPFVFSSNASLASRCSRNKSSKDLIRPVTARRSDKECVWNLNNGHKHSDISSQY
jgi:hypothetical protein